MRKVIIVTGMSCNHCKVAVEQAAKSIAGVNKALVDLEAKTLTLEIDKSIDEAALKEAIEEEGFQIG